LDRIDIHIDVRAVKFRDLTGDAPPETDDSAGCRHLKAIALLWLARFAATAALM